MKACVAGSWVTLSGGGGGATLAALTDVSVASPALGEILLFNGSSWVNSGASIAETDPQVGTIAANKWCVANAGGTLIDCTQNAPGGGGISDLTGDVTASGTGSVAATIAAGAVTYAKIQNVSATTKLLGRSTAGAGPVEELSIGSGLTLASGTLSASGAASQWTTTGSDIYYNTGNVGIGTTSPGEKLTVAGAASISGSGTWSTFGWSKGIIMPQARNILWEYSGTGQARSIGASSNGVLYIARAPGNDNTAAGVYDMVVDNSGNVGIGTASPGHKLDVAGDIRATGNLLADDKLITSRYGAAGTYSSAEVQGIWSIGDGYQIDTTANNFGTQYGMAYAYNQVGGSPLAGAHQVVFTNNGVPGAAIGFTGSSYFAGNMGIGTAAPAYKLDIAGTVRATGNYYTNGSLLMGQDGTSTILYGSSAANQYMALYGAASNVTGASIVLYGRTYSTTEGRISYYANTNTNDTTYAHYFLKINSSGTATSLMSIRSNGNMYVTGDYSCVIGTATTVSCTSDGRKKKDIETIPNALDSVVKLRGVTFRLKDPAKPQDQSLGFIAQEVMKVYPQAVRMGEDGYYTMEYAALVAPLVEAVKELKGLFDGLAEKVSGIIAVNDGQSAQIEALKAANDNLATENTQLRKTLDDLRERVGKLEYGK